jgi:hypothetical protein
VLERGPSVRAEDLEECRVGFERRRVTRGLLDEIQAEIARGFGSRSRKIADMWIQSNKCFLGVTARSVGG